VEVEDEERSFAPCVSQRQAGLALSEGTQSFLPNSCLDPSKHEGLNWDFVEMPCSLDSNFLQFLNLNH